MDELRVGLATDDPAIVRFGAIRDLGVPEAATDG